MKLYLIMVLIATGLLGACFNKVQNISKKQAIAVVDEDH